MPSPTTSNRRNGLRGTHTDSKNVYSSSARRKGLGRFRPDWNGKTAAFALPCIHRLEKHGACRALALAPTRELAIQIEENFNKYGKFLDLRMALLYGGVKYGKQMEQLKNEPDIIVATPGRLLDHLSQGNLSLKKIEILILDEVDRMLDMGFIEDVTRIINKNSQIAADSVFLRNDS